VRAEAETLCRAMGPAWQGPCPPTAHDEHAENASSGHREHLLLTDWPEAAGAGGPVLLEAAVADAGKPVSVLMLRKRTAASRGELSAKGTALPGPLRASNI
jgi:hypothetical protein